MPKAFLNLRGGVPERRDAFVNGLQRLGYEIVEQVPSDPPAGSIFISWNRIGGADYAAKQFEALGLPVLVAENATWGNNFAGQRWYTIARNYHNTAGCFPIGSNDRWDSLGVELMPWRTEGETVILAQRGIGSPQTAMPQTWPATQKGRLRRHPGLGKPEVSLDGDLANAGKVITWGSGSAIRATILGIPVESHMPNWVGACQPNDESRLLMLRSLAWAQATLNEIEDGTAFSRLLSRPV